MSARAAVAAFLGPFLLPAATPVGPTAPGASDLAAADTTVVTMTNRLTFEEDTVRITVGETVRWRNGSDLVHTVTADPERAVEEGSARLPTGAAPFHSGRLTPGETFQRTFREPGTYGYFCVPHEGAGMTGVAEVIPP